MSVPRILSTSLTAVALTAVTLTGCSSATIIAGDQLLGTWTGSNAGYEGPDAVYVDKPLTLVVQEANGPAFVGLKQWTEPDGTVVDEQIKGVVTETGQVTIVDGDGVFEGVLSGSTLTGRYVEMGDDAAVLEVQLTQQ